MKKRIAIVMVLLMILSVFPVAVFAEDIDEQPYMINVSVNFIDNATGTAIKASEIVQVDGNDFTYIYPLVADREALKNWICTNTHVALYQVYSDTEVTLFFDKVYTAEFKFQDEQGNELKEMECVQTGLGELVDISRRTTVKGYTIQNAGAARIEHIDKDYTGNDAIILVYKMNEDAVFDITVHFVDEDDNSLKEDFKTQVNGGESFNETFSIEGYEGEYELDLDKVIKDVETTFIFSKATYTVTIAYVDKDGNTLAPSKDITVEYGQNISEENPVINGYKTDSAKVEIQNVTSDDYVEVVYVKDENGGEDDPDVPPTGDNSSIPLMFVFLLSSCAVIIGLRKRIFG